MGMHIKPWEKQKNEREKPFQAFKIYRDLGDERSYAKVCKELSKSQVLIQRWATEFKWKERIAAYETYLDQVKVREHEKNVIKMKERHAKLATAFQNKIVEKMQSFNPERLSPKDMAMWLDISVKVERLSRGEVTESIQHEDKDTRKELMNMAIHDQEVANALLLMANKLEKEDEEFKP